MRRPPIIFLLVMPFLTLQCTDAGSGPTPEPFSVSDAELFAMQSAPDGWTYFGLSSDTLAGGSTSAHEPRVRVRYDRWASTQLTAAGRVKAGAVFPDSSLIVKELYTGGALTTIAYMFKLARADNASPSGWIWAETDGNGVTKISASRKGTGCVGCHATGIDFTRMNDTHP
jgi:hypothetical protein